MFFVVVLGGVPVIFSNTVSSMLRSIGLSSKAFFGLSMGGVLNIILDPIFMFVILPDGKQVMGAALATMLSNLVVAVYFIITYQKSEKDTVLRLGMKRVPFERIFFGYFWCRDSGCSRRSSF